MKSGYPICLAFLLLYTVACHQPEQKHPIAPPATTAAAPAPIQDQLPDYQTLTENHKILLIRVAGDLSKVPAATQTKISAQKTAFNTSFDAFRAAIHTKEALAAKLDSVQTGKLTGIPVEKVSMDLKTATDAAINIQGQYDELSRQFAQLIEEVRKARGH